MCWITRIAVLVAYWFFGWNGLSNEWIFFFFFKLQIEMEADRLTETKEITPGTFYCEIRKTNTELIKPRRSFQVFIVLLKFSMGFWNEVTYWLLIVEDRIFNLSIPHWNLENKAKMQTFWILSDTFVTIISTPITLIQHAPFSNPFWSRNSKCKKMHLWMYLIFIFYMI